MLQTIEAMVFSCGHFIDGERYIPSLAKYFVLKKEGTFSPKTNKIGILFLT